MTWLGIVFAVLATLGGLRYLARLRAGSPSDAPPTVDDDAIRRILETGTLSSGASQPSRWDADGDGFDDEDDGPLDLDEAARAEEDFWDESWDEPEEHPR